MNDFLLNRLDQENVGRLLERLLAISDDAFILVNAYHQIVLFNDGAERIFGYQASQVQGQLLALLLPESARASHDGQLRAFARSEHASRRMGERRDVRGRRADGTQFDAEASISHVELDGQTYFAAILRDVSASQQVFRALQRSEVRFRELAASAPVGIFQTDEQGQCVYVNEQWCSMAGMSREQAVGDGWQRAVHPMDRAQVQNAWTTAVDGGIPFDLSYRFVRPDGAETWVIGRATRNRVADGSVMGFLGTVVDVTASRLQARALEIAKGEAEASTRAKGLFLANMSHELRTPLNAIIGMTTLLLGTPLLADQQDFASTIRSSGETLLQIINDILDYSKAEVGRLEIEQRAFDLRRCLEESLDLVAPSALDKNLHLAYLIEDGTPEALVGDEARIRQILANLLSNAVKFTHHGEVFVTVESATLDGTTQGLRFTVQDSGIGIADELLPHLFQSFTQLDASTTRKYGGTGLGLAISRRLAELMGGTMSVRSEPGQGSEFCFTVQVAVAADSQASPYLQRDVPALAGKRVLIVDNNATSRRILTRLTMRWGMLPVTLASALEALDRVRHGQTFDVALLDMRMPGIDGLALAREIRRHPLTKELPIVLLTSLGWRQELGDEPGHGPAAQLAKPIKASQLFASLLNVFVTRHTQARVPASEPMGTHDITPMTLSPRVLVAEDNTVNQRVALLLLQRLGYHADVAANGLEVIEAVERQPYDVVLMDVQMPEMDGLQAARWIVQRRAPGGLPRIVAMTANVMPGDREAYLAAGLDALVAKPISINELAAVFTHTLAPYASAGAKAQAGEAVLDVSRLDHLRTMQQDNQPSLVAELIDMFVEKSPDHVDSLLAAFTASDSRRLGQVAHRFLSVTQNIGAQRLSALCLEIERHCHENRFDATAPLVNALCRERERAESALREARLRY